MQLTVLPASGTLAGLMGLAERRAIKAFQDNRLPALRQAIDAVAGFSVELEVDWDSVATPDYAHLYDEAFTKVYFDPLVEALKGITIDDLGKDALKAGLKKVVIKDEGSSWPTLESGVLTLRYPAVANLDYGDERRKTIQDLLEKGL